jgi:serine protease inhibitor
VNGIFLKGIWLTPFSVENTEERSFSLSPGVEIKVPIMHLTGKFRAGEDQNLGAKWVELPFDVSIVNFNFGSFRHYNFT